MPIGGWTRDGREGRRFAEAFPEIAGIRVTMKELSNSSMLHPGTGVFSDMPAEEAWDQKNLPPKLGCLVSGCREGGVMVDEHVGRMVAERQSHHSFAHLCEGYTHKSKKGYRRTPCDGNMHITIEITYRDNG